MAKRHHYVPVTYLRNFTDASGHLLVFRKDEPQRPFRQRPESTGFERFYYSQVADDGTRDDDRLEAIFSEIESHWPAIVDALSRREAMFDAAPHIITFLSLMRVRGPAFRDAAELHLGNAVHTRALVEHEAGRLPPLPEGHEDLLEELQISIDPHQSLIAMGESMNDVGSLIAKLSFDVLHNATDVSFLTSDNPVMYFDPRATQQRMLPYTVRPDGGRIELLFPISSRMALRGRTLPRRKDIGHRTVTDRRVVSRVNRLAARFAYRTVFASEPGLNTLICEHASVSPVVRFDRVRAPEGGYYSFGQFVFGTRPDKPRWDDPREGDLRSPDTPSRPTDERSEPRA